MGFIFIYYISYQPKEETIPFCLIMLMKSVALIHMVVESEHSMSSSKNKILLLRSNNDLVKWNATVNTIDEYEDYLQTGNNKSTTFRFCNCSDKFHLTRRMNHSIVCLSLIFFQFKINF
jgi:hypothetical protein